MDISVSYSILIALNGDYWILADLKDPNGP